MEEENQNDDEVDLSELGFVRKMVKAHWKAFMGLLLGVIGAIVGFLLVLYWILNTNWVGGYGTWDIGQFTIGNILGLFFLVLFLELLIVGIPFFAYEGIFGYLWWTRLPEEEKAVMRRQEPREKRTEKYGGAGGGFGGGVFLVFLLIIFLQGNWETPINSLPYIYWINNWLYSMFWIFVVIGIPIGLLILLFFLKKE